MYNKLKEDLAEAKLAKDKPAASDLIGVIDAVDKKVFAEKKKAGDDFIIQDAVVLAVLKNQLKNTTAAYKKALDLAGPSPATDTLQDTMTILQYHLPPAVEGDELRLIIQGLGAKSIGQAMGMLKEQSSDLGYDYDGREASVLAKEIFV